MENREDLEWRDVVGYEGLYEVSNYGDVRNVRTGRILPGSTDGEYERVKLSKDHEQHRYGKHRLVAQAFIPNPNNYPIINHKDENKSNNKYDNLEWCTFAYNNTYNSIHINRGLKQRFKPKVTEEVRQKIIESNRTRTVTEEHKRKTSESLKRYYKVKKEFEELEKLGYVRGITYEKKK